MVNLDPTIGAKIRKTRPCVVISPNEMNKHLKTIIIAPITSTLKFYPSRISITHRATINEVILDQIETIDKSRVVKSYDMLSSDEIKDIKSVLKEMLVD